MVQVAQRASGAAVYPCALLPAVGTLRDAVGVFDFEHMTASEARRVVGVRASVRAVLAAIAKIGGAHGAMHQKPERDRTRPLARRYAFGSGSSGSRSPTALTTSSATLDLWWGGTSAGLIESTYPEMETMVAS